MKHRWVRPALRDEVAVFVSAFSHRTDQSVRWILARLNIASAQFYRWSMGLHSAALPHSPTPREHWLTTEERAQIIAYHGKHPLDGYRQLTYMMIDADIVSASPATVYRVLRGAGLLDRWHGKRSKKGTGFVQPRLPHEHWHTDITYVNIAGTFYYLCAILDGASRYLIHWELRESMKTIDVTTIIQRAKEQYPNARPRMISDNGPQFVAKDFRFFIRISGMTHVRTSPYYPQSNGKIERWHKTLKTTTIRPLAPSSVEEARRVVGDFVDQYNHHRLHSAIGFITPADALAGRSEEIQSTRRQKLQLAREARRLASQTTKTVPLTSPAPFYCSTLHVSHSR